MADFGIQQECNLCDLETQLKMWSMQINKPDRFTAPKLLMTELTEGMLLFGSPKS